MSRELTAIELVIYAVLKNAPEPTLHVTPDGNHIYILCGEGDEEGLLDIERIEGKNFNLMNGDELNQVIIDFFS